MCVFGFVAQLFSANPGTGNAYGACHLVGDPQPHAPHSTGRYPRWLHANHRGFANTPAYALA